MGVSYYFDANEEQLSYATVEKYTLEGFKRSGLVNLFADVNIPSDIKEAEFKEAYKKYSNYTMVDSDFDVTFTVDIGYDRQETYTEYKKEYDSTIKQYRTVPVTKTRTVTDWKPFSGSCKKNGVVGTVKADNNDDLEVSKDYHVKESIRFNRYADELCDNAIPIQGSGFEDKEIKCDEKLASRALMSAQMKVEHGLSLPGDHERNLELYGTATANQVVNLVVGEYVMPFEYNEKKYEIKQYQSLPGIVNDYYPSEGLKIDRADKLRKEKKKSIILSIIVGLALGVILAQIPISILQMFGAFIGIGLAIAGSIFFARKYDTKINAVETEFKEINQQEKLEALEKLFQKLGYGELKPEEIERFSAWKEENKKETSKK